MMNVGDKFTWLRSEKENCFGELCEVISVNSGVMDYKFVNKPNWRTVRCPVDWFDKQKSYTEEEISAVRMRYKRRRLVGRDF